MNKRTSNLDGALLTIEILKRIPKIRRISAAEIRQQLSDAGFERDLRSIQRQLDALSLHFDIERDERNKPYGYRWKEHSVGLSLPTLTESESLLLMLAEEHLNRLLPASLHSSLSGFFTQAKSRLDQNPNSKRAKQWTEKVRVVSTTQPLLPPEIDEAVFATISNALYADHWLDLNYFDVRKRSKSGKVMPLGLAQQGERIYLVCRFEGYQDDRSLALHRITDAKDTGQIFRRPKDFNLKQYDEEGRFGFGEGKKIALKFTISKAYGEHILESRLSTDQHWIEKGDFYEITATVVESEQLKWWLRSLGKEATVLQPKSLRNDL